MGRRRRSRQGPTRAVRTCGDAIDLFTEYMERDLVPALSRRLREHLAGCPPCEEFLASLGRTRAAVRALRSDDIPEDCRASLRAFLDRELR